MGGGKAPKTDYGAMEQMQQRQFERMQQNTMLMQEKADEREAQREAARLARNKSAEEEAKRKKAEIEAQEGAVQEEVAAQRNVGTRAAESIYRDRPDSIQIPRPE